MAYLRRADGTLQRIDLNKYQRTSDDSGGPGFDSGGGWGDHDAVRNQDPSNQRRRPPMAAPLPPRDPYGAPKTSDIFDVDMGDDDDIFPEEIETDGTRWRKAYKAADASLAAYGFDRFGDGNLRWMVKSRNGRRFQYSNWSQVAKLADWRDATGRRPAAVRKSIASLHPPAIEVLGTVGKRIADDGNHALYAAPNTDRNSYRVVLRRPDGSIQLLPGEYPLNDIARKVLTDNSDGVLPQGKRSARTSFAAGGAD